MKLHRKIDLEVKCSAGFWHYSCSTNCSATCREAKERFLQTRPQLDPAIVRARFASF